jgi:hypothetical protein
MPRLTEHRAAVAIGCTLVIGGAWILHEAYDNNGRKRPFLLRFLPG